MIFATDNKIVEFGVLTRTAQEAATALNCQLGQIAKSIVFKSLDGKPVMVVASGVNRVDEKRLNLTKADAGFVLEQSGFMIGGVPPWGHKNKMLTYIDQDLANYEKIWAAAGKNNAVFELTFDELVEKTEGVVISIHP